MGSAQTLLWREWLLGGEQRVLWPGWRLEGAKHWERKKSSTPEVVPGAAPALAKAGVGGFGVHGVGTLGTQLLKLR